MNELLLLSFNNFTLVEVEDGGQSDELVISFFKHKKASLRWPNKLITSFARCDENGSMRRGELCIFFTKTNVSKFRSVVGSIPIQENRLFS